MGTSKKRGFKHTAGAGRPAGAGRKKPAVRRFTVAQKLDLMRKYEACGKTMREFCGEHGVCNASLCKWRRVYREQGVAGLQPKRNPKSIPNHSEHNSGLERIKCDSAIHSPIPIGFHGSVSVGAACATPCVNPCPSSPDAYRGAYAHAPSQSPIWRADL